MRSLTCRVTILTLLVIMTAMCVLSQDTSTDAPRTIRIIKDSVPTTCPIAVQHNFFVTFSYTAHVVTANNTIGAKFDETEPYTTVSLQANERQMLTGLYQGLLGACLDEARKIVIPKELSKLKNTPLMKERGIDVENSDVVFIVNIVTIEQFTDLFDTTDTNRDGCLTIDEITAYIKESGKVPPHLVDSAAQKLFLADDKNNDGWVECAEFRTKNKLCNANTLCTHAEALRLERLRLERLERERRLAEQARKAEEERKRLEKEEKDRKDEEARVLALKNAAIEAQRLLDEERAALEAQRLVDEAKAAILAAEAEREAQALVDELTAEAAEEDSAAIHLD